ncbi:MAG: CapA family protein [Myxococcota bacterium]
MVRRREVLRGERTSAAAAWAATLVLAACSNPAATGTPPPTEDAPPGRGRVVGQVGNNASGLSEMPDWDAVAKQIGQRMDGRFPASMPTREVACTKMLDAARDHYKETDGPESVAVKTMAATRDADLAACVAETGPRAAWCVATLVAEDIGEYPWLVDQCSRAFPTTPAPGPAAAPVAAAPSKAKHLEATFVGDVIFGRYRASGYDPIPEGEHEVFGPMHDALQSDLLVGNLETPLVRDLPLDSPIGSKFRFGASLEHAKNLVTAGFSVMSLANNHYYDMRVDGLTQTPVLLRELGLTPIGAARAEEPLFRVETVERNGWTIGFVAVSTRRNAPKRDGVPELPFLSTRDMAETLAPLVKQAKADHDLAMVVVHWGNEYAEDPDYAQVKAAHALVDAGADIVVGHHPHVLQAVEAYGGGLIAYSMGNFLFENTTDIPRLTGVLRVRFSDAGCFDRAVFHPAYIKRLPVQHPVPATGHMGRKVKSRVIAQGKRKRTTWVEEGDDLVLEQTSCGAG